MVQRYTDSLRGGVTENETGEWVSYEDYQKLQEELQQRAETAEATITEQDALILSYQETIRNQTAKLAELEKQEPYGWINPLIDNTISKEYGWAGYITPVFTRPAPAVSLAELDNFALYMADESVKAGDYPDGWQCKASNAAHEYAESCRAAILRNIEEQSK